MKSVAKSAAIPAGVAKKTKSAVAMISLDEKVLMVKAAYFGKLSSFGKRSVSLTPIFDVP